MAFLNHMKRTLEKKAFNRELSDLVPVWSVPLINRTYLIGHVVLFNPALSRESPSTGTMHNNTKKHVITDMYILYSSL